MNTLTISGTVAQIAETRETKTGSTITKMSVCWQKGKKLPNGEWENTPHYYDVKAWGDLGLLMEGLTKGQHVIIVAQLEQERWETTDGSKRSRHSLMAKEIAVRLLPGKKKENTEPKTVNKNEEPF